MENIWGVMRRLKRSGSQQRSVSIRLVSCGLRITSSIEYACLDVESGKHLDDIELSDKPLAIEVGRDNHVYVGFEDSITIFDKNSILIDTAPLEKTSPVFAFGR